MTDLQSKVREAVARGWCTAENSPGMTLRDYFAAHAPERRWKGFAPTMPPQPERPTSEPVGNDGEAPDTYLFDQLLKWKKDPIWDAAAEHPTYSHWVNAWEKFWNDHADWERLYEREADAQWPYWYADAMLAARQKEDGNG